MKIALPYGKGFLETDIPEDRLAGVWRARNIEPSKNAMEIIGECMEHPIGSAPLWDLAKGKEKVVIIASDHTRPVPSKQIIPLMLAQLRRGNPDADITILIATGCHRATRKEELIDKFGKEIFEQERIVIHDCEDEENLVSLGRLPSGGELRINRLAAEADLLTAEGFIEPHFFAGFSGGRKSVLPGIASRESVHYNHNSGFMDHPCAKAGILEGNPVHRDMIWAAKKARLAYIVNVVLNESQQVVAGFAGDCEKAHLAGAEFVRGLAQCTVPETDVVITSNNGYPLDQNVYQMVKCMSTAAEACRDDGVIIAVGECVMGVGASGFYESFRTCKSAAELLKRFRSVPPEHTEVDQWQSHILAGILLRHSVILVSGAEEALVEDFGMITAHSIEEALQIAGEILGDRRFRVAVIPEGISVIVKSDRREKK